MRLISSLRLLASIAPFVFAASSVIVVTADCAVCVVSTTLPAALSARSCWRAFVAFASTVSAGSTACLSSSILASSACSVSGTKSFSPKCSKSFRPRSVPLKI